MALIARLRQNFPGFSLEADYRFERGINVLFGPSGAGKSVSLRMLAGLLRSEQSSVVLNGVVLEGGAFVPPQNRAMGCVFQDHSLFPHMTVRQNILFGAKRLKREDRPSAVSRWLTALQLEGLEGKRPGEISGGQRQRVALARALIGAPQALLLDEPFSALDIPTRVKMRSCLKEVMVKLEIPVVLVTHDLCEAAALADRMVMISHGRVIQEGEPGAMILNPASPEAAELLSLENYDPLRAIMERKI